MKPYSLFFVALLMLAGLGAGFRNTPAKPIEKIKVILNAPDVRVIVLAPQGLTSEAAAAKWFDKIHQKTGVRTPRGYDFSRGLALLEVTQQLSLADLDVLCTDVGFPLQRLPALNTTDLDGLKEIAHRNGWR